jgi:NDP-sugar pyrophosphorylase family protein
LHPTVKLISPVFIAPNARIERGVTLGPNVVVGEGSVIDANTSVQNSLVCAKTYIGMDLEIKDSILEGGELFHTVLSASLTLREPMFLSRLAR